MNTSSLETSAYQPVVIIGAGRSGTNMLRDVLTKLPKFGTWPCDEINYIWRYGNARFPNDELCVDHATAPVKKYIRKAFLRLARRQNISFIVEKTCANSLRLDFVSQVLPNAKFIFIVRDGRDVVASAMKRWQATLDTPYVLKKARYIPITDLPYYGRRYLWNRIYLALSDDKRLAFWGPRFEGMEEWLYSKSLPEVCAMQWVRCVEKAEQALTEIDSDCVYRLRYEDFVSKPEAEIGRLTTFLNVPLSKNRLTEGVVSKNMGKWEKDLNPKNLDLIKPIIQKTMKRQGYC